MENPVFDFFNELKNLVVEYVEAKLQLTKLKAYEKLAELMALLFSAIVIIVAFFFVATAITFAIGSWLNTEMNSSFLGYTTVAGIYFMLFVLMVIFKNQLLIKPISNKLIKVLFKNENK